MYFNIHGYTRVKAYTNLDTNIINARRDLIAAAGKYATSNYMKSVQSSMGSLVNINMSNN